MSPAKKFTMTDEHKQALAEGRAEGRAVKAYLEALEANRPKRGRKRTAASIEKRLATIEETFDEATPLQRLSLVQERIDLTAELAQFGKETDLSGFEADFVKVAKDYSARKGLSYAAWRELGVAPAVLKAAGITRKS